MKMKKDGGKEMMKDRKDMKDKDLKGKDKGSMDKIKDKSYAPEKAAKMKSKKNVR